MRSGWETVENRAQKAGLGLGWGKDSACEPTPASVLCSGQCLSVCCPFSLDSDEELVGALPKPLIPLRGLMSV